MRSLTPYFTCHQANLPESGKSFTKIKRCGIGALLLLGSILTLPAMAESSSNPAPADLKSSSSVSKGTSVQDHQIHSLNQQAKNFFSVDLPQEASAQASDKISDEQVRQAMTELLVRITGQPVLLKNPIGQQFLAKGRSWLSSYNRVPVLQEGVKVGEKLRLNFDAKNVQMALSEIDFEVWPMALRPKTLVMGTLVQRGSLQKLDFASSQFRNDASIMTPAEKYALPISLPIKNDAWVFPVNPENNLTQIQELLLATDQNYLLSYKLVTNPDANELSWRVFAESGSVIAKGRLLGLDKQALLDQMVGLVMSRYVDLTRKKLLVQDRLRVNLLGVTDAQSLLEAKQSLQENLPTVTHFQLTEIEGSLAQFDIAFQGAYQDFLVWIQQSQTFEIVNESEALRQVDVNYIMPPEPEELDQVYGENGLSDTPAKALPSEMKPSTPLPRVLPVQPE